MIVARIPPDVDPGEYWALEWARALRVQRETLGDIWGPIEESGWNREGDLDALLGRAFERMTNGDRRSSLQDALLVQ